MAKNKDKSLRMRPTRKVDPKFVRNLRFSKKHNKGHVGRKAVKKES